MSVLTVSEKENWESVLGAQHLLGCCSWAWWRCLCSCRTRFGGRGDSDKSCEFRTGNLELCWFLFKELGMDLGAEHCLLLHGQIEIHYFSCDALIAIFLCVYRLYLYTYVKKYGTANFNNYFYVIYLWNDGWLPSVMEHRQLPLNG